MRNPILIWIPDTALAAFRAEMAKDVRHLVEQDLRPSAAIYFVI